jgi:four helix bundle protein
MTYYKNLDTWQKSMELVKEVYLITASFPANEMYALTSQTKRAAVSVPANIAEGSGRQYKKDSLQFMHVSRGSLYELETLLTIAMMVNYIDENSFQRLAEKIDSCLKVLNGYISYLEKSTLK